MWYLLQARISNWPKESPGSWFSEFKRGKIVSQPAQLLFSFLLPPSRRSHPFQISFSILLLCHFVLLTVTLSHQHLSFLPLLYISLSYALHFTFPQFPFVPPLVSCYFIFSFLSHTIFQLHSPPSLITIIIFLLSNFYHILSPSLSFFHSLYVSPVKLRWCSRQRHQPSADDLPEAAKLLSSAELHLHLPSVCGLARYRCWQLWQGTALPGLQRRGNVLWQ